MISQQFLNRTACILLAAATLTATSGCDLAKTLSSTSFTTTKAPVTKVYSVTDGGFNFVAYVVDAGGTEIVVSDPLGQSRYKVGDTIEYMAQKIEVVGGTKTLSYTLMH